MLEAIHLTKCYAAVPAVQAVTFSLAAGQVLGCLGPNGSGKSTTVKMLTGLLQPTRGKVLFQGHDIHDDLVGYRRCLGYVPEEPNLYPYLTGREYLEMVGLLGNAASPAGCENRRSSGIVCNASAPAFVDRIVFQGDETAHSAHIRSHPRPFVTDL